MIRPFSELTDEAKKLYPYDTATSERERAAYVRGYLKAVQDSTKINENDFFSQLAEKLRNLWPAGEKDGKYPWRDSVQNLAKRLKLLWQLRSLKNYSMDDCLTAANKYLAQFETNAKYMKTLKYFILRQNEPLIGKNGKISYTNSSTFADMLEGLTTDETQSDWENAFDTVSTTFIDGELI